jgi:TolA-binding protein
MFHRAPTVSTPPAAPVAQAAAVIEASSSAELEHVTTASGEVVRVRAGKVRIAVDGAAVVKTGDAEIDGATTTKTTYEITVAHDKLVALVVTEGRATLAIAGQHAVILAAGETWTAPVITADVTPGADRAPRVSDLQAKQLPPTIPAPPPPIVHLASTAREKPSTSTSTSTSTNTNTNTAPGSGSDDSGGPRPEARSPSAGPSAAEQHFASGWAALRANDFARAATELGLAADGDGPIAADARYFQAIAFTKAGRKTEAERAYVQFLDRAPKQSLRRGRATVALARLIAERGDRAAARAWFASAIADPDPAVAAAAKAGLAAP